MVLFSYIIARDYGFAPNPFGGYCTLAACKPGIRRAANIGDWVIGTGSARKNRRGYLVYAMKISETMSFDKYWGNPRFQIKKPNLCASKKLAFGDNIYHRTNNCWSQVNSHHSYENGAPNIENLCHDTQTNRVLISDGYVYWGGHGPKIPPSLRCFQGCDICAVRNYKRHFPAGMKMAFIKWFSSMNAQGYVGRPADW